MPGILAPFFGPLRRLGRSGDAPEPSKHTPSARRLARRLADALDRAMEMGLWDHADRLARRAAPLAHGYARLAEPLARLRLAQGDPETALRVIDASGDIPSSLRMLRVVCLLMAGARAEVDLDLHRWAQKSSAPLDCRLLLALLERHRDPEAALRSLQRNLKHLEDPRTLQTLLLLAVLRQRPQQAEQWAGRLRRCGRGDPLVTDMLLQSLGLTALRSDAEPTADQVHALAMELIAFEPSIDVLTEAQRLRPDAFTVRLLRRAIEQATPDLAETAEALRALARLAMLEGDLVAARRFVERALAHNPMSAELALLLQQLTEPTPPSPANVAGRIGPREPEETQPPARRAA